MWTVSLAICKWTPYIILYHITLLREVSITEALWSHPLDRQLHFSTSLSEIGLLIYILRQTKICNLYQEMGVNPLYTFGKKR